MSVDRYEDVLRRLYAILRAIDGESSISSIAEKLGWRRASLYTSLRTLEKLGMIKLVAVPGPPKKVVPVLTEKGRAFLECLGKALS
jgi:Sugar-specific transcriptional regulator TrmB.